EPSNHSPSRRTAGRRPTGTQMLLTDPVMSANCSSTWATPSLRHRSRIAAASTPRDDRPAPAAALALRRPAGFGLRAGLAPLRLSAPGMFHQIVEVGGERRSRQEPDAERRDDHPQPAPAGHPHL